MGLIGRAWRLSRHSLSGYALLSTQQQRARPFMFGLSVWWAFLNTMATVKLSVTVKSRLPDRDKRLLFTKEA